MEPSRGHSRLHGETATTWDDEPNVGAATEDPLAPAANVGFNDNSNWEHEEEQEQARVKRRHQLERRTMVVCAGVVVVLASALMVAAGLGLYFVLQGKDSGNDNDDMSVTYCNEPFATKEYAYSVSFSRNNDSGDSTNINASSQELADAFRKAYEASESVLQSNNDDGDSCSPVLQNVAVQQQEQQQQQQQQQQQRELQQPPSSFGTNATTSTGNNQDPTLLLFIFVVTALETSSNPFVIIGMDDGNIAETETFVQLINENLGGVITATDVTAIVTPPFELEEEEPPEDEEDDGLFTAGATSCTTITYWNITDAADEDDDADADDEEANYNSGKCSQAVINDTHGDECQNQALLAWVRDHVTNVTDLPRFRTRQRYALAMVYCALDGDHWQHYNNNENKKLWFSDEHHECEWLATSPMAYAQGLGPCDPNDEYKMLQIWNAHGSLPTQLALMTSLQQLSISDGTLSDGILPPEYYVGLSGLQTLRLVNVSLTGTIPAELGTSFDNLTYLDLSHNRFRGTIPNTLTTTDSRQTELKELVLHGNCLTGTVPRSLALSSNLQILTLYDNDIRGDLSDMCLLFGNADGKNESGSPELLQVDKDKIACDCCSPGDNVNEDGANTSKPVCGATMDTEDVPLFLQPSGLPLSPPSTEPTMTIAPSSGGPSQAPTMLVSSNFRCTNKRQGNWTLSYTRPGNEPGDSYGGTVTLSNDARLFAVGSTQYGNGGLVEVVDASNTNSRVAEGTFPGESNDSLGWDVAISGDGTVLAAAGPRMVRLYKLIDGTWIPLNGEIAREVSRTVVGSGGALSMSNDGSTLVVGAPTLTVNEGTTTGQALIYEISASATNDLIFTLQDTLDGDEAKDLFGKSVSISADGNTVAIGARGGGNERGYVRTFSRTTTGVWEPDGSDLVGMRAGNHFGDTISLSADGAVLAVGTWRSNYIQVYERRSSSTWMQVGSNLPSPSFIVSSVLTPDGDYIAIGDPLDRSIFPLGGSIKVYQFSCGNQDWEQVGQTVYGGAEDLQFGRVDIAVDAENGILTFVGSGPGRAGAEQFGNVDVYQFRDGR